MASVDRITDQIIGSAIAIHSKYGPGLLESVYAPCRVEKITEIHVAQLLTICD